MDNAIHVGIVKNNADPAQHGRLQVYIPALDSSEHDTLNLPWAINGASPLAGVTAGAKVGRNQAEIPGMTAYGFWAIPKIGAQVLCVCLEGETKSRAWIACLHAPELNRTMPHSIEGGLTEIDESGKHEQWVIPNQHINLFKAGLQPSTKHYRTRGGYERSISHPSNKNKDKPTDNGYAPKALDGKASDSQTICLTSPGRHYFVMSDVDEFCRIRLKTCEGSQIIFDDTNERIYISTAQGKNWIEMDEGNGKIYVYSDSKINIRGKNDVNIYSDENINLVAKNRVNICSEERSINLQSKHDITMISTDADVLVSASRDINLCTFNGPQAAPVKEESLCGNGNLIYRWSEKGGSATSKIRINAFNSVEIKSDNDGVLLSGNTNLEFKSFSSDINIQGNNINIKAKSVKVQGESDIHIKAPSILSDPAVPGPSGAGSATVAESATAADQYDYPAYMVRPDHESWERDEDEAVCPTPRNAKYQG